MRIAVCPLILAASLIALSACGKGEKEPQQAPERPSIEVSEVAAADGYGAPGETVNAVAFWSHPSLTFESLLLVATDAGVEALNIETGEQVDAIAQGAVSALSVVYTGSGAGAEAYVVAGRPNGYEFYSIDNASRSLAPVKVESGAPRAGAFCAGRAGDDLALYEISNGDVSERAIDLRDSGLALGDPRKIISMRAHSCHVDDRTGDVIIIARDGGIHRLDPKTGETFGLAFGAADATATALFLMTTAEPENAPGGAVGLLDGETGVISLFDLADGHALGAVRVKSTFDLEAVASATTMAAGYGNYGGVYRDGALAVVTTGDGAPIRLVPWNGVLAAISQPLGETVDPRAPQAVDDDAPVIEIDLIEP
ncbi:MAG TPA: hypothetical protein PKM48_03400 [Parvularculaceae bacterium]|nr:hypothetical protein [Parvularculaceae bacterium]